MANIVLNIVLMVLIACGQASMTLADNATECRPASVVGFSSRKSCTMEKMRSTKLRVAYLDKQYVTQNFPAIEKAKALGIPYVFGRTCDRADTAIPEW